MLVVYKVRVLYKTCIKMYNLNVFPLVIAMPMEISMRYFNIYLGRAEIYIFFQYLQVQVLDLRKVPISYFSRFISSTGVVDHSITRLTLYAPLKLTRIHRYRTDLSIHVCIL